MKFPWCRPSIPNSCLALALRLATKGAAVLGLITPDEAAGGSRAAESELASGNTGEGVDLT